jgi:hypothetical protein
MTSKLSRLTQKNSYMTAPSGRELYHLQFSLQATSLETFGYAFVYTSLDTDKDCNLLRDRPVLSAGRTLHDKQNCYCLEYNQNLIMSPRGAQRPDGLTDSQSVAK